MHRKPLFHASVGCQFAVAAATRSWRARVKIWFSRLVEVSDLTRNPPSRWGRCAIGGHGDTNAIGTKLAAEDIDVHLDRSLGASGGEYQSVIITPPNGSAEATGMNEIVSRDARHKSC